MPLSENDYLKKQIEDEENKRKDRLKERVPFLKKPNEQNNTILKLLIEKTKIQSNIKPLMNS